MTDTKALGCTRCGYLENLESHHIEHKAKGGSDDDSNRRWLCQGCHDYQHAKEAVLEAIEREEERLEVLKHRLEIIEQENGPGQIIKRGYQSYFSLYNKVLPSPTKCITAASGDIYDEKKALAETIIFMGEMMTKHNFPNCNGETEPHD